MLLYMIKFKYGLFDGGKEAVPSLQNQWWWGISPEGFGTVAMTANFIVSIVISRFTAAPPQDIQDMVEEIRIPRGAGVAQVH